MSILLVKVFPSSITWVFSRKPAFRMHKRDKTKFFFKTYEIENTTSSSGTFSHCQNDLYKRALRAHFKLQKCLGDIKPNINTLLHLFDHTVKPILTY